MDDNCNGILDDGCPCGGAGVPCYALGLGSQTLAYPWDGGAGCAAGLQACVGGLLSTVCSNEHVPQVEFCDGADTDCDGLPDPVTCPCQNTRACYQGPPNTVNANAAGRSLCRPGTWSCAQPLGQQCVGQVLPAARETCDGFDDDCNGLVDDQADTQPCGPGVCSGTFKQCVNGAQPACTLSSIAGYSAAEVCGDGLDNNCTGVVDDGCVCVPDAGLACWTGPAGACPTDGGPCRGTCARGTQVCGVIADGGTGYGACTGQALPGTESCTNGSDDDCDGTADCSDNDCGGRTCGAGNGRLCVGTSCTCVVDGGTAQPTGEQLCNDGRDNDCDALIDCGESYCNGRACGLNGRVCVGTNCACTVDGGTAQPSGEQLCSDGRDNDCDGLTDCAESFCNGASCATGKTCVGGACTCVDAGVPEPTEATCTDGKDNDCDGLTDCNDPNCAGRACGTGNGYQCSGTSCACSGNGAAPQNPESSCNDGRDNDCDGFTDCADSNCTCTSETSCSNGTDDDGDTYVDCADPDCFRKPCLAGQPTALCCTTYALRNTPNSATCRNLANDPNNCGQCGAVCPSGTCVPRSAGSRNSGACTCPSRNDTQCPSPFGTNQRCVDAGVVDLCSCGGSADKCGNEGQGSMCYVGTQVDICGYQ